MKDTHIPLKRYGLFPLSTYVVGFFIVSMIAVAVLAYLNPGEILRRMRDEKRKEQIRRLSDALSEYYGKDLETAYPTHTSDKPFTTILSKAGITLPPIQKIGAVDYIGCSAELNIIAEYEGVCYVPDENESPSLVLVYTRLESQRAYSICRPYENKPIPYFTWSSLQGVTGIVCASSDLSDPTVDYIFENS